jgi:hypothetical protein
MKLVYLAPNIKIYLVLAVEKVYKHKGINNNDKDNLAYLRISKIHRITFSKMKHQMIKCPVIRMMILISKRASRSRSLLYREQRDMALEVRTG